MGLSCRCCKKKGRCVCKACPTIASESLALEIDYKQFDIDGQPFDSREDVPNGPLFGPEPPYPEGFEINATCGYAKPKVTSDREQGINGCGEPYPPFEDPLPCGEFAATMTDPETGEPYEVICPEGYTCDGAKSDEVGFCEPIPGEIKLGPDCINQYDKYTCEGNGPRMGRVGPPKESTYFGIGLIPNLIECTDPGDGTTPTQCPEGYTCVESTDPPEKIQIKDPLPEPTPCDDDDAFVLDCPTGYECRCNKCEPEKVDAPIKSFCELEETECGKDGDCPEGYECTGISESLLSESICQPISPEITKKFLQHPIQAQFGLYPCENPHKNEVCAPQDTPIPCDIPDCVEPVGKLPDQCEECTDEACREHFGPEYICNRDGDCEKKSSNPCPEGFECKSDPSNPIVDTFPSRLIYPFCTDQGCEDLYGPGFKCNGEGIAGLCEIDPADGMDANCNAIFSVALRRGQSSKYVPAESIQGAVCLTDVECEEQTGTLGAKCVNGECVMPAHCKTIPTNCLPVSKINEPDWIFQEHDGLPVFLVPMDGLPHGPLPLFSKENPYAGSTDDAAGISPKARKLVAGQKRAEAVGACNDVDNEFGECTPDCCYETFGDPWLPNHEWKCRERKIIEELEPLEQPCGEGETRCPLEYTCQDGNCEPISCDDDDGCSPDQMCVNGQCRDKDAFVPQNDDSGEFCYLELTDHEDLLDEIPIGERRPYNNKEDDLDPLVRDFPKFKEFTCPDSDQQCGNPDDRPCPDEYICKNNKCKFDCEAKYGPGAKCEDGFCQPACSDDLCEEKYGVGFKCDNNGNCELVRDRDLDSLIPRALGEISDLKSDDQLYFGHPSAWGGSNNDSYGVGVFNLNSTKIRTRLYLDYGYHLNYPFDKGHMDTELVPTGCPVEQTPKTDVWKYKGNKGHRHPYPKVHTIAIGSRYPSVHNWIDDEEGVDDFVKVGSGPYFGEYCDRAMGTEEPGGLEGLGDPVPTNWNPESKTHENDDYSPKYDPDGVIKGCDPAFVVPCDTNPSDEIEFDYLSYVRSEDIMDEDGLNRTGLCKKDMDAWRVSNQSVYSHINVPSGPVGGLIIDKVKFIPVDYRFPAHTTTPDMWLWNNLTKYGDDGFNWKLNRVFIPATTLPVYMAVYYNSKIGHEPIRYDELPVDQFLPPPNGWLENIWQLGDIANPLDVNNIQPNGAVLYSRPANTSGFTFNARRGYKYWSMTDSDYADEYGKLAWGLPVDRHWDMPSKDTCESDLPEIETTCTDLIVASRWTKTTEIPNCNDETDLSSDDEQCVCVGYEPFSEGNGWEPGQRGRSPANDCIADPPSPNSYQGIIWKAPAKAECDDEYCEETFGDGAKCDGDGNCTYTGCPEGYKCGCPDEEDDNPLVEPVPPQDIGSKGLNIYEIEMEVSYVSSIPNPAFDPNLNPPDPNIPPTIDGPIIKTTVKPNLVTAFSEGSTSKQYVPFSIDWQAKSQAGIANPLEPLTQRGNYHQAINHGIDTPYWDAYHSIDDGGHPLPIYKDPQLFVNNPPEDELQLEFSKEYNEEWSVDSDDIAVYFEDLPNDVANIIDVKVKVRQKGAGALIDPETGVPHGGISVAKYSIVGPDYNVRRRGLSNEIEFSDGTIEYDPVDKIYEFGKLLDPSSRPEQNKVFGQSQPCPQYINRLEAQWPSSQQTGLSCGCDQDSTGFSVIYKETGCVVPSTDVLAFRVDPNYNSKSDWYEARLRIQLDPLTPTCDQLGEGFEYVGASKILDENDDPVSCNDDPDTDCEQRTGVVGSKCIDGECWQPPTCQKPNRFCIPCDPCNCDTEEGFHLQSCGDLEPDVDENGKIKSVPCGDDVKRTKHLFDFWNEGVPFPSNNGDVTDGHLTWYQAELDQYGEVQLKPWINPRERDIEQKWPERNIMGVQPPDPKDNPEPCGCGNEPCPPGFICEEDLCIPGEGSMISTVTYPPLLYTGLTTGGYETQCGIKNQRTSDDRAIKQWWFEQPYHPGTPVKAFKQAGGAYATYLAQIGVSLNYHWYDQDWLQQEFFRQDKNAAEREILEHMAENPPKPRLDEHVDVREVYRRLADPVKWDAKTNTWISGGGYDIPGIAPKSDRNRVGQPVGSYHGRDGMTRYNIHPWAQIYSQVRITDSLLEMGRDFHEVQQVLSSIELECTKGVFKNGTPTIVEPFGYDETGNVQFQLNQPHGSHLAEVITPRILNYRPTRIVPPGNATQIKIGGPGQAMCVWEYQYPMTMGGAFMTVIFMPGGTTHGVPLFKIPTVESTIQPFVSQVVYVTQTYPGYGRGASATRAEEFFTNRAVETEFGDVEFHQGPPRLTWTDPSDGIAKPFPYNRSSPGDMSHARNVSQYQLNDGAYTQGKVYGVSKWPYDNSTGYITGGAGIDNEKFPDNFYVGGHGYFDPEDLQKKKLQNLDPDKGLFTYCFIAGMNGRDSLPGLPKGWTFGMVGGSFHSDFNHSMGNGNANSPKTYDFPWPYVMQPGTSRRLYRSLGHIEALKHRRTMPGFDAHYFSKYDYQGVVDDVVVNAPQSHPFYDDQFELTYYRPAVHESPSYPVDGNYTYTGNIAFGMLTTPNGTTVPAPGNKGLDAYASEALLVKFMTEDMTDPEFLKQYYYAQVYSVRGNGPRFKEIAVPGQEDPVYRNNFDIPIVAYNDVSELENESGHDVHLILKREGQAGRLIEGPAASTFEGYPEPARYYRTAKYQRLDGEECVDTYDKECAVGGSSPCGDAGGEPVILYTLDKDETCEDCAKHVSDFTIQTDDYICVAGQLVENDDRSYCGDNIDKDAADQYCVDLYGEGYTCAGCCDEFSTGQCRAPDTCQMQGLLPANNDGLQNGVMDQIITLPADRLAGLEYILPLTDLDKYLQYDDNDDKITGIKDLDLYYIANQYGSDGSIAPNGQIITDKFLRDLYPSYFYDSNGDPSKVSLRGAVLDSQTVPGYPGYRRVFFSVGHPDVRPDFAKQEYICARMTDPATGLHNSDVVGYFEGIYKGTYQHGTISPGGSTELTGINSTSHAPGDMNKCIKTSRFYSGERSDFVPLYGNLTWQMELGEQPPQFAADSWERQDHADPLGATPFHWPWAIGDLCVDWAAGSPRRGGNMGDGVDGRYGFNHENALENVKKYYTQAIENYGPEDFLNTERTVAHNEFPNSYEAELYKLAIISGTTNTGDMLFFSDSHRQKNDILQAKPPCKLWTNIYDFKWPLTPATGINTPAADPCNQTTPPVGVNPTENVQLQVRIDPPENTGGGEPEGDPETEPRVNTVHGNLKINIGEKPIIRFKAGGTAPGVDKPDKLWFAITGDGCDEEAEEHDPPVKCDPNDDNFCGDDYECRTIEGCDDPNTYCMPKKCDPRYKNVHEFVNPDSYESLKEYRRDFGFEHLVLQPTTNPVLDNYIRCPLHYVEVPHWGPEVQLKSALFNRDLITIDECSACDIDCDCREPGDPEPIPPLDPEQICGRWNGDEECPDGYDCLCHRCQQPPFKQCLKADAYGCRRCLEPSPPAITITEPVDYSASIFDPNAGPNGFAQNCAIYIDILDNNGNDDTGCGSDEDCYSAVDPTVARYSNFREQYPYITTEEIQCGDPCQFLNVCPPGFICNDAGDFCDPIPFGDVPPVNGTVDIKVNVTPGSGSGADGLTKFAVERVIFTITKIQSEDPDANDYLKPILNTTLAVQGVELENGVWGMEWDTTNSFIGGTQEGLFQIMAAVYDTGDLWCLDVATVRTAEFDDSYNETRDQIYNSLIDLPD